MTTDTEIAKILLEIKAVTLNLKKPYRYASGILSPIYTDNRLIISHPDVRKRIIQAFVDLIHKNKLSFDIVAGTATAGIPHAAWLSDQLNKPMVYVRSKSKGHGKGNQIEGKCDAGQQAIIVEDLISTGNSALSAAQALREKGAIVSDCIAIFDYEMKKSRELFSTAKVNLFALTTFSTLIEVAAQTGALNDKEKTQALAWNQDPEGWGKTMGFE